MQLFLYAIMVVFLGGFLAFILGKWRRTSNFFGAFSCLLAALLTLKPLYAVLIAQQTLDPISFALPLSQATITLDSVSAFFALPVVVLGSISAFFAAATSNPRNEQYPGAYWFFYNLLMAGMLTLLCTSNAVLFIMAWEIMSVAAFFLIAHRDEHNTTRNAAWRFLIASHIGTAAIFFLFAILSTASGSYDFAAFANAPLATSLPSVVFFLALFGFGVKVGIFPLHIWLPESYTFAESHVSAVLSGAMSKMGFYGLIRVMMFLPNHLESWGWALLLGGVVTGIFAMAMALTQIDLKKVISYSSMENAGIIMIALGAGLLANLWGAPIIALAAFIGAFLHVLNHAVCKGLLFLCAGSVYFATGTRNIEQMGGIAKAMPFTATLFGIGSMAIAGLPPFNSFISEILIFLAGLKAATLTEPKALLMATVVLMGLGLIGGLAVACFARLFGLTFLGAQRSNRQLNLKSIKPLVNFALFTLALMILAIALAAPTLLTPIYRVVVQVVAPTGSSFTLEHLQTLMGPIKTVSTISAYLIILTCLLTLVKRKFFSKGEETSLTWDCGFLAPTPRIQYTASSFAQPANEAFIAMNNYQVKGEPVAGLFPKKGSLKTHSEDFAEKSLFQPMFYGVNKYLIMFRGLQHGKLHLYVCYIAVTLLVLLLWKVVL
jgi:hydrogenase-4 component B